MSKFFNSHFFYSHVRVLFAGAVLIFQKNRFLDIQVFRDDNPKGHFRSIFLLRFCAEHENRQASSH